MAAGSRNFCHELTTQTTVFDHPSRREPRFRLAVAAMSVSGVTGLARFQWTFQIGRTTRSAVISLAGKPFVEHRVTAPYLGATTPHSDGPAATTASRQIFFFM